MGRQSRERSCVCVRAYLAFYWLLHNIKQTENNKQSKNLRAVQLEANPSGSLLFTALFFYLLASRQMRELQRDLVDAFVDLLHRAPSLFPPFFFLCSRPLFDVAVVAAVLFSHTCTVVYGASFLPVLCFSRASRRTSVTCIKHSSLCATRVARAVVRNSRQRNRRLLRNSYAQCCGYIDAARRRLFRSSLWLPGEGLLHYPPPALSKMHLRGSTASRGDGGAEGRAGACRLRAPVPRPTTPCQQRVALDAKRGGAAGGDCGTCARL